MMLGEQGRSGRSRSLQLPVAIRSASIRVTLDRSELACLTGVLGLAVAVGWLTTAHPTLLPAWAPWEFSWTQFLAAALAVIWYGRGVVMMPAVERPSLWRQMAFLLGVGLIYAVLLTHFEYMA